MQRREFIAGLGSICWLVPHASAQKGQTHYRVGLLIPSERETPAVAAFFDELRTLGFLERQNLTVISGGGGLSTASLSDLAQEMVKLAPDVILSAGLQTRALQG